MTILGWVVLVVVVAAGAGTVLFVLAARRFIADEDDSDLARSLPAELVDQVREERRRR